MATGVGYSATDNGYLPVAGARNKATGTWKDASPHPGVVCAPFSKICSWATAMSCASASSCMLLRGSNDIGQLGRKPGSNRSLVPIRGKLPRTVRITAISTFANPGVFVRATGQVAVSATGQVYTWAGPPVKVAMSPKSRVGTVTAIAAGAGFDLALTSHGIVLAWGVNRDGELGDGTTGSSPSPVRVRLPSNVRASAIAAAEGTGFALTSTGQVYGWGFFLTLADGGGPDIDIPLRMEMPPGSTSLAIAAGSAALHSFAIVR